MSYTVVGMFPSNDDAARASEKLDNNGFAKEDYSVSNYRRNEEIDNDVDYEYDEDANTTGFWESLFSDNEDEKRRYSYAGTKSNVVTVYTDDSDRAEEARDIMNDMGAINVIDYTKDYYPQTEEFINEGSSANISADERARIIAKARSGAYLDSDRSYTFRRRDGINDPMDSQGDTF